MAYVYILFSKKINAFYIGSCKDLKERLKQHNDHSFNKSFTKRANDWIVFYSIDNIEYQTARKIEKHIKNMKSRKYIINLIKYPEITLKLMDKYK